MTLTIKLKYKSVRNVYFTRIYKKTEKNIKKTEKDVDSIMFIIYN